MFLLRSGFGPVQMEVCVWHAEWYVSRFVLGEEVTPSLSLVVLAWPICICVVYISFVRFALVLGNSSFPAKGGPVKVLKELLKPVVPDH